MKFDFENINLIPKKSIVESRSQCDTSIQFGDFKFQMPIVPANMEAVVNIDIAIKLASSGYFYIMHRFDINQLDFIRQMKNLQLYSSISIGVNEDSYQLIEELISEDLIPHFITIDIAHGHCIKMEKMLKFVKEKLPHTFIIAGNVSTPDAVEDLQSWGADALKVGIGPGCFVGESQVITSDGTKKLNEINIGDFVITHKNRLRKVLEKHEYIGEQELIKVNNLPLCTKSHEFYVIEKKDRDKVNEENISDFARWVR
jgi:hypothetical protein